MEANQGTLTGTAQIIGPDGKVKGEFTFTAEAEQADEKELNNGSDTRNSRKEHNSGRGC